MLTLNDERNYYCDTRFVRSMVLYFMSTITVKMPRFIKLCNIGRPPQDGRGRDKVVTQVVEVMTHYVIARSRFLCTFEYCVIVLNSNEQRLSIVLESGSE